MKPIHILICCLLWISLSGQITFVRAQSVLNTHIFMPIESMPIESMPIETDFDCTTVSEIPQVECEALVAFYHSTDGPNWENSEHWLETTTPCRWYGIDCVRDSAMYRISGLYFYNFGQDTGLNGVLPPDIGNLTALTSLRIPTSKIQTIPAEIGNLTALTWLDLRDNELTTIPPEIGNLSKLRGLTLNHNQLVSLPSTVGRLTNLTSLDLNNNQLVNLPPELGNLSSLNTLYVSHNQLVDFPPQLGNLSIYELKLEHNHLTNLPPEFGNLTRLRTLIINANHLTTLPPEFGNLSELDTLHISGNKLMYLPDEFMQLPIAGNAFGIGYNRLNITNPELLAYLTARDRDWAETQTMAPSGFSATALSSNSIELSWTPVDFVRLGGRYEIGMASGNRSFSPLTTLEDKRSSSYTVLGLEMGETYRFRMRTYTPSHLGEDTGTHQIWDDQPNDLWSDYGDVVSATTLVPADIYEANDACEEATLIQPTGITQTHSFHILSDIDWVMFEAPAIGAYRLEAIVPDTSPVDLELYAYTDCGQLHDGQFIETFTPNARFDVIAETAGQPFYFKLKNYDIFRIGLDVIYEVSVFPITEDVFGNLNDGWSPYIASVRTDAVAQENRTAQVMVEVRHAQGEDGIDGVWADIYPPVQHREEAEGGFISSNEAIDTIDFILEPNDTHDTNTIFMGRYTDFVQLGLYPIVVHARDVNGQRATPVVYLVDTRQYLFLPVVTR